MGLMGPGQFILPTPQSMGAIGGQGGGTARAVERRVKIRRDISRLPLLDNSVFLTSTDPYLYHNATCDLFAPSFAPLCPRFYLPLVHMPRPQVNIANNVFSLCLLCLPGSGLDHAVLP